MRCRGPRLASLVGALVATVCATGCKIEPVLDLVPEAPPVIPPTPGPVIPDAVSIEEDRSQVRMEIMRQLSTLAGPAFGGRRVGTDGATATVHWLETSMRQIGLIPDGVGGGWQQPVVVQLESTADGRIEFPRVLEGEPPDVLVHGEEVVLWRAGNLGTWNRELALVEAGHGVTALELGHDDYAGLDVAGKVVVVEAGLPPEMQGVERLSEHFGSLAYKMARAKKAGAAGCLVTTEAASGDPRFVRSLERFNKRRAEAAEDPVVLASKGLEVAGLLSAEAEAEVRTWINATRVRALAGAPPVRARIFVRTDAPTLVGANVVGRIPGSEHPEEVVVVLAHWDAGGTGRALVDGGGLQDNASGVAALLGLARMVVHRLALGDAAERSVVFAATAADTLGVAGTHTLLETGPLAASKVVAVISLDDLLVDDGGPSLGAVAAEQAGLADLLDEVEHEFGQVPLARRPHGALAHRVAFELGVPGITLTRHDPDGRALKLPLPETTVTRLVDDVVGTFEVVWTLASIDRMPTPRIGDGEEEEDDDDREKDEGERSSAPGGETPVNKPDASKKSSRPSDASGPGPNRSVPRGDDDGAEAAAKPADRPKNAELAGE